MVPLARRLLLRNRGGLFVTIAGVAATVSLLLFLFAVHAGVKDGSTRYVRTSGVDVWIAQKGSDNILKSSSFVPVSLADEVAQVDGVLAASPLVRVISKAEIRGRLSTTLFLFGFDPQTRLGAPHTIIEGTADLKPGEIVLDESFARKYDLGIGDTITLQRRAFRVSGLSAGTNALVSQFGFVRLADAQEILALPQIASFIVVRARDRAAVVRRLQAAYPELSVYEGDEFTRHHEEEMDNGVLPVFAAAAVFGAAVGGFIVALMLYSSALERREDYATLKAIGAGQRVLLRLVVTQALLVTLAGCIAGAIFTAAITPVLLRVVPALTLRYSLSLLWVVPAALFIAALSASAPLRVLRRIYPGEVFRA